MSERKPSKHLSTSISSISSSSSLKSNTLSVTSYSVKTKFRRLFSHHQSHLDTSLSQGVLYRRTTKIPKLLFGRHQQLSIGHADHSFADENAVGTGPLAVSTTFSFECDAQTFAEYMQHLDEALTTLRNLKREEYESQTTLKILRFLENLSHQPKEWISGAKLKLSEMKFSELAITLMNSYEEKGYLIRQIVFDHSILLYYSITNFTDHGFDKEGSIRRQLANAGFIEFAYNVLDNRSYLESLTKSYQISNPEETMQNDEFHNYQKILYICDSALAILYNLANSIIAAYTKLPSNTIRIQFPRSNENEEYINSIKELREIGNAIIVTACWLLPLIMNEDEDNLLSENTSEVLPLLSGMIQTYHRKDQRFYGFSFIELVNGLSKLMVPGRTHRFVDQNLLNLLLDILKNSSQDDSLLECISNAILNASFDDQLQKLLDNDRAIHIIRSTRNITQSQLVQKNCEAILWTLNRIPHKDSSSIANLYPSQGHIMISYNRSATVMCLKIRDRLKSLYYTVWLDVDNINGGVLQSMAQAVENSCIVLMCMNEEYKQSYYCRLEAEYATELRKSFIPCLMEPRFRPYGWLGIIKGAKLHVDFATLPFEEAFPLLIREIETIRKDVMVKTNNSSSPPSPQLQPTTTSSESIAITDWNADAVQRWLEDSELSHLANVFVNMDGKLLRNLYQMKPSAPDAYYKLLHKYFYQVQGIQIRDMLKFDRELQSLFFTVHTKGFFS